MRQQERITIYPNAVEVRRKNRRADFIIDGDSIRFLFKNMDGDGRPSASTKFNRGIRSTTLCLSVETFRMLVYAFHEYDKKHLSSKPFDMNDQNKKRHMKIYLRAWHKWFWRHIVVIVDIVLIILFTLSIAVLIATWTI